MKTGLDGVLLHVNNPLYLVIYDKVTQDIIKK